MLNCNKRELKSIFQIFKFREKDQMEVFAISKFAKDLLEVIDCLEMALENGKDL